MNRFHDAGKNFRDEQKRNAQARDKATALLADISKYCRQGIQEFYSRSNDVYVKEISERQMNIEFGFRPGGKVSKILRGRPFATIFVTPEGHITRSS